MPEQSGQKVNLFRKYVRDNNEDKRLNFEDVCYTMFKRLFERFE